MARQSASVHLDEVQFGPVLAAPEHQALGRQAVAPGPPNLPPVVARDISKRARRKAAAIQPGTPCLWAGALHQGARARLLVVRLQRGGRAVVDDAPDVGLVDACERRQRLSTDQGTAGCEAPHSAQPPAPLQTPLALARCPACTPRPCGEGARSQARAAAARAPCAAPHAGARIGERGAPMPKATVATTTSSSSRRKRSCTPAYAGRALSRAAQHPHRLSSPSWLKQAFNLTRLGAPKGARTQSLLFCACLPRC